MSTGRRDRRLRPSEADRLQQRRQSRLRARESRPPARDVNDRPPGLSARRDGIPVEWERSTMAHLASVYPFHADAGFGERGVRLGTNVTAGYGGFYFDPFEFYTAGYLTNPNMVVLGQVGHGKSATVKAFIRRLKAVYGTDRYVAIIDPKGEYSPIAADLGLPVVKLYPGGPQRVNPMDPGGGDSATSVIARQSLADQLVAGVLGRELSPLEDAVLGWAVETACRRGEPFTLRDVCQGVLDPPEQVVRLSRHTPFELTRATAPVSFALDKLCTRTLRGMFDEPTNVHIDWNDGPGVVLDLSGVQLHSDALPLVMVAATHWLADALRGHPNRRSIQVIDEAWAAIRHGAAWFQSSLKLSRAYGVATVLVCHRPSDLTAQADDGTAAAKIAAGLLSDIQTRVLLKQPPEQVAVAAEMFDLTDRQRCWLGELVKGRAIWQLGTRSAMVHTVLTEAEKILFDTDTQMRPADAR
jgi:type IV secretory pathway VirB4 component